MRFSHVLVAMLLVGLLIACGPSKDEIASQPAAWTDTPTATATETPTLTPTLTLTPTTVPTSTPTPTPTLSPYEIPLPDNTLTRIGKGSNVSVAVSQNGLVMAISGAVGVGVYQVDTFEELWFLPVEGGVWGAALSPDGQTLAIATVTYVGEDVYSGNAVLSLWDIESNQQLQMLESEGVPWSLAFNRDGTLLAMGSLGTVSIWDVQSWELLRTLPATSEKRAVKSIAWHPDNAEMLVTGSTDGFVTLWDVSAGLKLRTMQDGNDWVLDVVFSPDGGMLLSTDYRRAAIWEAETGRLLQTLGRFGTYMNAVAWSPDGTFIASSSNIQKDSEYFNVLILWDVETGEQLRTFEGITDKSDCCLGTDDIVWLPDGKRLITRLTDGVIVLLDTQTGEPLRKLDGYMGPIYQIAWSPDGKSLALGLEGKAIIYDVDQQKPADCVLSVSFEPRKITWSPDGSLLATSNGIDPVSVWDAKVCELRYVLDEGNVMAWSPDGRTLVTGYYQNPLLWEAETGKQADHLPGRFEWIYTDIAYSPDGDMIAAGVCPDMSGGIGIVVWDTTTRETLQTLVGYTGMSVSIAWSPNGKLLASGSGTNNEYPFFGEVIVYDTESWESAKQLISKESSIEISSVAWSPDGSKLAASGIVEEPGSMHAWYYVFLIWDAATWELLQKYEVGVGGVLKGANNLAWSPGGRLAYGSDDGSVIIWDFID